MLFHLDKRFRVVVTAAQQYRGVGKPPNFLLDQPRFATPEFRDSILAEHSNRFDLPVGPGVSYMALACGVGGGPESRWITYWFPPQMKTACPHHLPTPRLKLLHPIVVSTVSYIQMQNVYRSPPACEFIPHIFLSSASLSP